MPLPNVSTVSSPAPASPVPALPASAAGGLEEQLRAEVASASAAEQPCSLLVLRPAGCYEEFVELVEAVALAEGGDRASVFALADDAFALLLPETPLPRALSLARLLELRLAFVAEGRASIAIGAAVTEPGLTADELFARAHLAMLEAEHVAAPTVIAYGRSAAPGAGGDAASNRLLADLRLFERMLDTAGVKPSERVVEAVGAVLAAKLRAAASPGRAESKRPCSSVRRGFYGRAPVHRR